MANDSRNALARARALFGPIATRIGAGFSGVITRFSSLLGGIRQLFNSLIIRVRSIFTRPDPTRSPVASSQGTASDSATDTAASEQNPADSEPIANNNLQGSPSASAPARSPAPSEPDTAAPSQDTAPPEPNTADVDSTATNGSIHDRIKRHEMAVQGELLGLVSAQRKFKEGWRQSNPERLISEKVKTLVAPKDSGVGASGSTVNNRLRNTTGGLRVQKMLEGGSLLLEKSAKKAGAAAKEFKRKTQQATEGVRGDEAQADRATVDSGVSASESTVNSRLKKTKGGRRVQQMLQGGSSVLKTSTEKASAAAKEVTTRVQKATEAARGTAVYSGLGASGSKVHDTLNKIKGGGSSALKNRVKTVGAAANKAKRRAQQATAGVRGAAGGAHKAASAFGSTAKHVVDQRFRNPRKAVISLGDLIGPEGPSSVVSFPKDEGGQGTPVTTPITPSKTPPPGG